MEKVFESMVDRVLRFLGYRDNMDPYLREMMPLFILYRFAARGPFEINENGKFVVKFVSLHGLYFTLSYGLLTYCVIDGYQKDNVLRYFSRGDFVSLYTGSMSLIVVLLHFSLLLSLFTKWEPTVKYIEEWAELNVEYEQVMGTRYEYMCEMKVLIMALSLPLLCVLLVTAVIGLTFGTEWYHLSVPTSLFMSNTSEYMCIIFSCRELTFMASSINSKLESLMKNNRMTEKELYALRRLWLKCCRVAWRTGTSNTLQLLLDVAFTATVYSIGFFALLSSLTTGDFNVVEYLTCVVISWIRLFCLFEAGELTAHNAGSDIRFTISTAKIDSLDVKTANEVELFIQCISSNCPSLNINGFTWVSRRSLFLLMAEANLYIMVLIQIQLSRKIS